MIDRYTKEEMKEIWTLEAKFRTYLQVELAVCKAWFKNGKIGVEKGKIGETLFRIIYNTCLSIGYSGTAPNNT